MQLHSSIKAPVVTKWASDNDFFVRKAKAKNYKNRLQARDFSCKKPSQAMLSLYKKQRRKLTKTGFRQQDFSYKKQSQRNAKGRAVARPDDKRDAELAFSTKSVKLCEAAAQGVLDFCHISEQLIASPD